MHHMLRDQGVRGWRVCVGALGRSPAACGRIVVGASGRVGVWYGGDSGGRFCFRLLVQLHVLGLDVRARGA